MSETNETVTTLSNREQFELLLKNHAPYIQAGDFQLHNDSDTPKSSRTFWITSI